MLVSGSSLAHSAAAAAELDVGRFRRRLSMRPMMLLLAVVAAVSVSAGLGPAHQDAKPGEVKAAKLTQAQVAQVRPGMTLAEVMAVLGPRAEINPDPRPFASGGAEVLVLWREGRAKWVGVIF